MKTKRNCIFCDTKITDTEFEFEDYYEVHRGVTANAIAGYICFNCMQKYRKK